MGAPRPAQMRAGCRPATSWPPARCPGSGGAGHCSLQRACLVVLCSHVLRVTQPLAPCPLPGFRWSWTRRTIWRRPPSPAATTTTSSRAGAPLPLRLALCRYSPSFRFAQLLFSCLDDEFQSWCTPPLSVFLCLLLSSFSFSFSLFLFPGFVASFLPLPCFFLASLYSCACSGVRQMDAQPAGHAVFG